MSSHTDSFNPNGNFKFTFPEINADLDSYGAAALHQQLASESEAEMLPSSDEDRLNGPGKSAWTGLKVTLEEVRDEDDPPSPVIQRKES